jgi:hypothetical protein
MSMMSDDESAQLAQQMMDEVQRHGDAMQGIMQQHGMVEPADEDEAD